MVCAWYVILIALTVYQKIFPYQYAACRFVNIYICDYLKSFFLEKDVEPAPENAGANTDSRENLENGKSST